MCECVPFAAGVPAPCCHCCCLLLAACCLCAPDRSSDASTSEHFRDCLHALETTQQPDRLLSLSLAPLHRNSVREIVIRTTGLSKDRATYVFVGRIRGSRVRVCVRLLMA